MSATAKTQFEVVWCSPATRSLIRHQPKPARFKEFKHARAFVGALGVQPSSAFTVICSGPVENTITEKENVKLIASNCETVVKFKWEVVGRSPDDYTITHMVCSGPPLGFSDRAEALKCVEFVKQYSGSIRSDLIIDVVPWKETRQWQSGYATEFNSVVAQTIEKEKSEAL
jgi:hypothetical protein